MEQATTIDFASAARALTREARRRGLVAPSFRCPPRLVGIDRSIRRRGSGIGAVVSVRLGGRPFAALLADMIEGVVAANQLRPPNADRVRAELWASVEHFSALAGRPLDDQLTVDRVGSDERRAAERPAAVRDPIAGAA